MNSLTRQPPGGGGQTAEHRGDRCWCVMTRPFKGPLSDTPVFSGCQLFCSCRMRCHTKNGVPPDELLPWDEGTQRRPHGSPLVPRRPQRVSGFSCRSVRRPPALPQSARALAAPSESVCCIDGVAKARVSRKILFEDRQRPAHNQPRSPRSHEVRVRSAQSCRRSPIGAETLSRTHLRSPSTTARKPIPCGNKLSGSESLVIDDSCLMDTDDGWHERCHWSVPVRHHHLPDLR